MDYEWFRDALIAMLERVPTDEEVEQFRKQFIALQRL